MSLLVGDRCIHTCSVLFQQVNQIRRKRRKRTIGSSSNLQRPLSAVMWNQRCAKNLRKIARSMAAQRIHLP